MFHLKSVLICASRMSHILNFHIPYIESLRQQGYSVDIAAEGAVPHPLTNRCYDMRFVKDPLSIQNIRTVSMLREIMLKNNYDIVISNSTLSGAAARTAAAMLGKSRPECVHISHGYMFDKGMNARSQIYRTIERLCAGVTDKLVVMNREDLILALRFRLGKRIFFTDGMGLDTEKFPPVSEDERKKCRMSFGASDDTMMFLCCGELSGRKNQALLIEAFDIFHRRHPDSLLLLAGNGGSKNELKMLVQKLELDRNIRFLGHRTDMNILYRSSDVLLSASKMEGLPFNVLEALYCGLPVIASDIKGHRDLIDKNCGMLFRIDAHGAEGAAKAMAEVSDNKNLHSALKSGSHLDEKYYIQSVRPKLLSVITRQKPAAKTAARKEYSK